MLTRISPFYNGLLRPLSVCVRTASNSPVPNSEEFSADKDKKMSRAMRYYLQKRRNYEEFIGHHQAEFDMGKQHLANMMGVDAKTMTQKDIDEAIGMKQESQKIKDYFKNFFLENFKNSICFESFVFIKRSNQYRILNCL